MDPIFLCLLLATPAWGLPIRSSNSKTNLESEIAPGWVYCTPNGRGTWDILWSCLITLTLCVWTALHLNVPDHNQSVLKQWLCKLKWLLLAIFFPEIVLYSAWDQYRDAGRLSADLNEIRKKHLEKVAATKDQENKVSDSDAEISPVDSISSNPFSPQFEKAPSFVSGRSSLEERPTTPNPPEKPFSLTYGFYVLMGGFVVDVRHLHNRFERVTLTSAGVRLLAEEGLFLEIADDSIRDKSKADWLAKALVCIQVLWLVLQILDRVVFGLPIALIELHTAIHVACALILYTFWFHKPKDINDPTVIESSRFEGQLAHALVTDHALRETWELIEVSRNQLKSESPKSTSCTEDDCLGIYACQRMEEVCVETRKDEIDLNQPLRNRPDFHPGNDVQIFLQRETAVYDRVLYTSPDDTSSEMRLLRRDTANSISGWSKESSKMADGWSQIYLSSKDILRWNTALQYLLRRGDVHRDHPSSFTARAVNSGESFFLYRHNVGALWYPLSVIWEAEHLLARVHRTIHDLSVPKLGTILVVTVLPSCYAGLHMAAWDFLFPTEAEKVLWRICSALLLTQPLVVLVSSLRVKWLSPILRKPKWLTKTLCGPFRSLIYFVTPTHAEAGCGFWERATFKATYAMGIVLVGCLWVLVPVFLSARVFLVVESFISLRHVPAGVYAPAPWTSYIPHL